MNDYLYQSMIKHGVDAFEMFPLEFVDDNVIAERELWWMHHLDSLNKNKGYNLRSDSSSGMHVHADTRKKISDRLRQEWQQGFRDGHSEKMKQSWQKRDRLSQSKTMTKSLTKYVYVVTNEDGTIVKCSYKDLKDLGLRSVLSKFFKKKSNFEKFKNVTVERVLLNEG